MEKERICADCKQPVSVAIDQGDDVNYYHDSKDDCLDILWNALRASQREAAGLRELLERVRKEDSARLRLEKDLNLALARTEKEE